MPADPLDDDLPPPRSRSADRDAAHGAALDAVTSLLQEQARLWARQLRLLHELDDLASLGAAAGVAQFPQLEMAGSWNISQVTASRWQWEAERFRTALPRALAMLEAGELLEHQAKVLLHRTRDCTVEIAQAVEAVVLPEGASLCTADLGRRVERAVLRLESEQADASAAEQRHADAASRRRTFVKPEQDGMGLAGAVLTAEQLVGWRAGLDALERRERVADREAGVDRTAEQRRADLFAALPAMVLAGTAQDLAVRNGAAVSGREIHGSEQSAGPSCGSGKNGPSPQGSSTLASATPGAGPDPDGRRRPWTSGPEQLAAQVVFNVFVPVSTVLGLSREPGSIEGYGPISAEHIRLLRPHSWRRVMVGAGDGRPVAVDDRSTRVADDPEAARAQVVAMLQPAVVVDAEEPQHDPSARLARLVDVRDVRCCGPGCSSSHTHRDHLEPHPLGPTSAGNLGRLSPRCHRAKHAGWVLVRHPDGSVTWTSPLGRVYERPSPHEPPPHVDLWQDLPPLRPAPVTAARPDDDERPEASAEGCQGDGSPGRADEAHGAGDGAGDDGELDSDLTDQADDDAPPF